MEPPFYAILFVKVFLINVQVQPEQAKAPPLTALL